MRINNKTITKTLLLLIVGSLLMTSIAWATGGVEGVINNAKTTVGNIVSGIIIIGTFVGVSNLAVKRNWVASIITVLFGFGLAYIVSNPDKVATIIDVTMKGIV